VNRILWSPQSLRDLDSIHAYIAQDSERYAELVIQRLLVSVERLAEFPESGRVVPEGNDHNLRVETLWNDLLYCLELKKPSGAMSARLRPAQRGEAPASSRADPGAYATRLSSNRRGKSADRRR